MSLFYLNLGFRLPNFTPKKRVIYLQDQIRNKTAEFIIICVNRDTYVYYGLIGFNMI